MIGRPGLGVLVAIGLEVGEQRDVLVGQPFPDGERVGIGQGDERIVGVGGTFEGPVLSEPAAVVGAHHGGVGADGRPPEEQLLGGRGVLDALDGEGGVAGDVVAVVADPGQPQVHTHGDDAAETVEAVEGGVLVAAPHRRGDSGGAGVARAHVEEVVAVGAESSPTRRGWPVATTAGIRCGPRRRCVRR